LEADGAAAGYFLSEIEKRQPGRTLFRTGISGLRPGIFSQLLLKSSIIMEAKLEQIEKILPEDLARTFESAYNVFQGKTEHVDDLLKHGGILLRKASNKFSPTQMVVGIAALAVVAVVLINRANDDK
jgi:hypothetical protein